MRSQNHTVLLSVFLCALIPLLACSQSTPPATVLTSGTALERDMKGGEFRMYTCYAQTGQVIDVIVDQKGIDVALVLVGPEIANSPTIVQLEGHRSNLPGTRRIFNAQI
jgi:hypothetical protein